MKSLLFALAGLGIGGAWYMGSDSPDFDRVIDRPPTAVYAAFSSVAQSGVVREQGENGFAGRTAVHITKKSGEEIRYELRIEEQPVLTAVLNFAPAGEGGQETRMTAEFDLDAEALEGKVETDTAVALSSVPEPLIDLAFAQLMGELADDVEARRPLRTFDLVGDMMRRRQAAEPVSAEARQRQAARAQQAAARPMTNAAPMVDPNAAAREHMRGGGATQPNPDGGWGR